jgi:hypothetical protein
MVIVAVLLATDDAAPVIPAGADPAVVPEELVYHAIVPAVPSAILAVLAAKVAVPAVPLTMVPLWTPSVTVPVVEVLESLESLEVEHPKTKKDIMLTATAATKQSPNLWVLIFFPPCFCYAIKEELSAFFTILSLSITFKRHQETLSRAPYMFFPFHPSLLLC